MTFQEAVRRLATRVDVDLEAEVDVTNVESVFAELLGGLKKVSRETFQFYQTSASLTLSSAAALVSAPEYDLFDSTICPKPIFSCDGVYINGQWLTQMEWPVFSARNPEYLTEVATSTPSYWMSIGDSTIRISSPANATAIASTCYVRGFSEFPTLVYAAVKDFDIDSYGCTRECQLQAINAAALEMTVSHTLSPEGNQRRALYEREYSLYVYGGRDVNGNMRPSRAKQNLDKVQPLRARTLPGSRRRVFGVGRIQ